MILPSASEEAKSAGGRATHRAMGMTLPLQSAWRREFQPEEEYSQTLRPNGIYLATTEIGLGSTPSSFRNWKVYLISVHHIF